MSSQSHKKQASFSWERKGKGSSNVRNVNFKALKKGEKIGFGLGGEGKRQEVVSVREGTQSYWKGVLKGYKIVTVNGKTVDAITIKSAIRGACSSGKDFVVGMQVPGMKATKDDCKTSPDERKNSSSRSKVPKTYGRKAKKRPQKTKEVSEKKVVEDYIDERPIIDNGANFQENADDGNFFMGEDEDAEEYVPIKRSNE